MADFGLDCTKGDYTSIDPAEATLNVVYIKGNEEPVGYELMYTCKKHGPEVKTLNNKAAQMILDCQITPVSMEEISFPDALPYL